MTRKPFDPKCYLNREQLYIPVPGYQGIRSIWEWNKERKRYFRREVGEFQYYAHKKIGGRQYSRCFPSLVEARRWRESPSLFQSRAEGGDMIFETLVQRFLEHKKARVRGSTMTTYRNYLPHLRFFMQMPVRQINSAAIDSWLAHIKRPQYLDGQHSTRLSYLHEVGLLRQILTYYSEYLDDGYQVPIKRRHNDDAIVDLVRYKQAQSKHRKKFIPREDFERFLSVLRNRANSVKEKRIYVVALTQLRVGVRVGEACALALPDINFDTGAIRIHRTVVWSRRKGEPTSISPLTKTGEPRTVWATPDLLRELRSLRDGMGNGRSLGLIFSPDGSAPIAYRSVQYRYNRALISLGLPWRSTQIMRHSMATDFLEATGGQLLALKEILGHSKVQQTEHYGKATTNLVRQGVAQYQSSIVAIGDQAPVMGSTGWVRLGESPGSKPSSE